MRMMSAARSTICFLISVVATERTVTLIGSQAKADAAAPVLALWTAVLSGVLVVSIGLTHSLRPAMSGQPGMWRAAVLSFEKRIAFAALVGGLLAIAPMRRDAVWESGLALTIAMVAALLAGAPPRRKSHQSETVGRMHPPLALKAMVSLTFSTYFVMDPVQGNLMLAIMAVTISLGFRGTISGLRAASSRIQSRRQAMPHY